MNTGALSDSCAEPNLLPMCPVRTLSYLVGPPGFEPGTSCTPSKRASQAAPRPERFILSHPRPRLESRRIRMVPMQNIKMGRLIVAAILAIFVYGVIAAMLGTIMPSFTLTPEQKGNVALAQALGLVIASISVG